MKLSLLYLILAILCVIIGTSLIFMGKSTIEIKECVDYHGHKIVDSKCRYGHSQYEVLSGILALFSIIFILLMFINLVRGD